MAQQPSENSLNRASLPYPCAKVLGQHNNATLYLVHKQLTAETQQPLVLTCFDTSDESHKKQLQRSCEALSKLNHANIASFIEADSTADGHPYLATEFIDGQTLHDYIAQHKLNRKASLKLFLKLTDAVAHCHRNLIVHGAIDQHSLRVDSNGEPKLFGFDVDQHNTQQDHPGVVGDIVALGKLLQSLNKPATEQVSRNWQHQTIPKDLQLIIDSARDPQAPQHYTSVVALQEDLERFLDLKPIKARPNTLSYTTRRWVQRHRTLSLASLSLLILLTSLSALAWRSRNQALAEAESARKATLAAQAEMAKNLRLSDFLHFLTNPNRYGYSDPQEIKFIDLLQQARNHMQDFTEDDPYTQAYLIATIAETHLGWGEYEEAVKIAQTGYALLDDDRQGLHAYSALKGVEANAALYQGQLDRAETILCELLPIMENNFSPYHENYVFPSYSLALVYWYREQFAEAEYYFRRPLEHSAELLPQDSANYLKLRISYSWFLADQNRIEEARQLQQQAWQILQHSPHDRDGGRNDLLEAMAELERQNGDIHLAIQYLEETLHFALATFDPPHPKIAQLYNRLGATCTEADRFHDANRYYQAALDMRTALFGSDDYRTAQTSANYAMVLSRSGQFERPIQMLRQALAVRTQRYGEHHRTVASIYTRLGDLYDLSGQHQVALELHQKALVVAKNNKDVAFDLLLRSKIIRTYLSLDNMTAAQATAQNLQTDAQQTWPDGHFTYVSCLAALARLELARDQFQNARQLAQAALQMMQQLNAPNHRKAGEAHFLLAESYANLEQRDAAQVHLQAAEVIFSRSFEPAHPFMRDIERVSRMLHP